MTHWDGYDAHYTVLATWVPPRRVTYVSRERDTQRERERERERERVLGR